MSYLQKFRSSSANRWLQRLLRVIQFLSAIISLGFFSARLHRLLKIARDNYTTADGAVEGILAAAVLYSLLAMLLSLIVKNGGPKFLRWFLVIMDILFVGAFIAVATLTSPKGGNAGPNSGDCAVQDSFAGRIVPESYRRNHNCNLPWGTFILAIISTILHALTAAFHEIRDHHKEAKYRNDVEKREAERRDMGN
ncbi:hypothetical protein BKA67DRAFT_539219 [Truncatella angustata]|uniref:MARVEL domain-containing protein n=1 Tax=Truncatella angustata TaxID=152316 RepID=A0A9P8RNP1_9PEZI|nr:uncharacterized protein BKA67DRAFT_539219 [Truncatella angustata]KAH6647343.1 hypothetical protein BKA67DRAFT_539219 [Truncatella angustata]KAH8203175.1 hypothetical protein TruAng_002696 [Truncatella angustata]